MPERKKHNSPLRRQSASKAQRKCSYSHSMHQGKYPHLEKLAFHCIMYRKFHLETLTH